MTAVANPLMNMEVEMDNVPVHIVGYGDSTNGKFIYFKFKLTTHSSSESAEEDEYETGVTKANCLCKDGVRPKKAQIKSKEKLVEYLKDYPFGIGTQPCYARLAPIDQMKTESAFVTSTGIVMEPKWFASILWHGSPPPTSSSSSRPDPYIVIKEVDIELQNMTGNPLNLEVEKLSNVPGKFFRRKRWRCRNGLGFVRFMYEGQMALARMCGRDFFIHGKPGSLPLIDTNHELDVTMELRRLKKPGLWPQIDSVNSNDPDELVATEFVSPAAWTGPRPAEAVLKEHLRNSEVDMFMLPKEFVWRLKSKQDNDGIDNVMDNMEDADCLDEKCKVVKDAFPLPKDAVHLNQAAILIKFVSNFLVQLELRSSPSTEPSLVGKKVFVSRNRFYTTDGLVMKAKETFDHHVDIGHEIHCDIAPQAADDTTWVATIAWLGGLSAKPDIEPLHWHHELNRKAQRGKILSLEVEPEVGASSGLIYNLDSGERAVFSRDNVYLFGTCLAKMDLSYVLSLSDKVKLVTRPIEDPTELKEKYGGLEVYREAVMVWVGETPRYIEPGHEEARFAVDKGLTGLLQYLNKRSITIDFFVDFLVPGHMPAKESDSASKGLNLMAATDLRGQVVELKRPDCGNLKKDTVNGILRISSGELAGKLAFFPRHCLHIFGHNMHKANLMEVVLPKEEFNVELVGGTNNSAVPYTVRAAWIGPRPTGPQKEVNGLEFMAWLTLHKLTEAEFQQCVKGERPPRPFFPFPCTEVHSGKIVALNTSSPPKGVQAGILTITKGSLEKQNIIFEANSLFVHSIHFEHGDLAYILKEGEKVTVEVTEFSGGKERKRIFAKAKSAIDKLGFQPLPNYYAQLVYIGSRPKAQNCCPSVALSELEVECTPNLKLWLTKRNLTCGFFNSLIQGLAPPKPLPEAAAIEDTLPPMEKNPFAVKAASTEAKPDVIVEGPPNVPTEVVRETMAQTDAMIRRVMKCTSPEDVNIKDVISNEDELQLAMFIAKSLASAISFYNLKTNRGEPPPRPIERPPPLEVPPRPIGPPQQHHSDPYFYHHHQGMQQQQQGANFRPLTFDYSSRAGHHQSNFQNRGLCGLREPLLNYHNDHQRQRRRSGEQFRNAMIEPPFKRKFFQNDDRFY